MKDTGIPDTTRKPETGATVQGRPWSRQRCLSGVQSQAEGTAPGGGSGSSGDSAQAAALWTVSTWAGKAGCLVSRVRVHHRRAGDRLPYFTHRPQASSVTSFIKNPYVI